MLQSCLKTREMPFQRPEISKFPGGGGMSPDPPRSSRLRRSATGAFGARPYSTPATPSPKILDPPLELCTRGTIYWGDYLREGLSTGGTISGVTIYRGDYILRSYALSARGELWVAWGDYLRVRHCLDHETNTCIIAHCLQLLRCRHGNMGIKAFKKYRER